MNNINRTVFGVGYFPKGKYSKAKNLKYYNLWQQMLRRCYDPKYHLTRPTYIDCLVDEKWHNFQVFAEWCENNIIDGFELDKDLLFKGNKIYGPDTCCFIPTEINKCLCKTKGSRGELPIGIQLHGKSYRVRLCKYGILKNFGCYPSISEAFKVYVTEKKAYLIELANMWKHAIPDNAYNALINYVVEITD